ncbi:MAG TPA: TIM-barrel domain-containing protein [Candidatus Acidoferrales bacterium]|jgi:alpha-glucosidase/alpha-D-xyloside xylohydrolase|nr:TIM-barrel domain-containing protein [Candidatus Acidoferrales bacterium]
MKKRYDRREVLKGMSAACAAFLLPEEQVGAQSTLRIGGQDAEIQIGSVSKHTFRLSILPIQKDGRVATIPTDGSLVRDSWGIPLATMRGTVGARTIKAGGVNIRITTEPLTFTIETEAAEQIQKIGVDEDTGIVSFVTGESPILALGEGGPQFDRRGSADRMRSGQGGYKLATHGGRVPIPWLIGTSGWAMFIHQPFGTFDFTGPESKFLPESPDAALPLDIFFVASREPATIMAEYARLTGHAEMPPLWAFGYQQSHRTLASRDEILAEAKTFREKKLPCDALIYLGTGFCPSGWNTENGSFSWNSRVFPDPKEILDEFHKDNFRAVLHAVIQTRKLRGTVHDPCALGRFDEEEASCYWDAHRKDFALGVDGWWPDEGDPLDIASRLTRNRMYWEGPQIDRPNERPYALHRNGYAGMQRYASFLWSGDVYSTWETLKVHIPNAINTALSGIPYWGTDIGGFVPTKEFTAELYLRWFQFGSFCTLFRCHGRTWKLRLPWGWDTGDPGPVEINNYGGAAIPDASQLHNTQVEPICRKYLELRYRMLPYLYSAVRECAATGMPIMRALWLHYPDDPVAIARDDEYLWGRDVLVAPVFEKGATSRRVYLPRGSWYDFWTGERAEGGREIQRDVDLETMPLFVRAGAILPLGPVKQYTSEKVDAPLSVTIYPGADGSFLLYEDDGKSFNYRKGDWMGIKMAWNDSRRVLSLHLAEGSRMLPPARRQIEVKLEQTTRQIVFEGRPIQVTF